MIEPINISHGFNAYIGIELFVRCGVTRVLNESYFGIVHQKPILDIVLRLQLYHMDSVVTSFDVCWGRMTSSYVIFVLLEATTKKRYLILCF